MQHLPEDQLDQDITDKRQSEFYRRSSKNLKVNFARSSNVRSLEGIEAKVHRLTVYYKRIGRIPENWKYKSVIAQLE